MERTCLKMMPRDHVRPSSSMLQPFFPRLNHVFQPSSQVGRLPGVASLLRRHTLDHTATPDTAYQVYTTESKRKSDTSSCLKATTLPPFEWTAPVDSSLDGILKWNKSMDHGLERKVEERKTSAIARKASRPKTSRYLHEIDRRQILMRIAQGEKQATLAKEYHVSRAAICNLNKHRVEVLSRNFEHPLAKHPKRRIVTKWKRQNTRSKC